MEIADQNTVYGVFYRPGPDASWLLYSSRQRGKSPYYGQRHTAQSFATWLKNNGPDSYHPRPGYEYKVMSLSGTWQDALA